MRFHYPRLLLQSKTPNGICHASRLLLKKKHSSPISRMWYQPTLSRVPNLFHAFLPSALSSTQHGQLRSCCAVVPSPFLLHLENIAKTQKPSIACHVVVRLSSEPNPPPSSPSASSLRLYNSPPFFDWLPLHLYSRFFHLHPICSMIIADHVFKLSSSINSCSSAYFVCGTQTNLCGEASFCLEGVGLIASDCAKGV